MKIISHCKIKGSSINVYALYLIKIFILLPKSKDLS
jgi:hypothetical protein